MVKLELIMAAKKSVPKVLKDRRLWTIQPSPEVRDLIAQLRERYTVAGFNRNQCLNTALIRGLEHLVRKSN
jgi:hypothetical protein